MLETNMFSRHIARLRRLRSQAHNCVVDIYNPLLKPQDTHLFDVEHDNFVAQGIWEEHPSYQNIPAMISFNPSTGSSQPSTNYMLKTSPFMKEGRQVIRLIINPDLDILKGAKIVITYVNWSDMEGRRTRTFLSAGSSREGQTAQIVFFEDEEYLG